MREINVLVACEESQAVTTELRRGGLNAFSCDIIDCSGGHNEWHIKADVIPLLNGNCTFTTADGVEHIIDGKWDMIIAHPPCTRLCNSGQRWCHWGSEEYRTKKLKERQEAINFFMKFANADCDRIVIENPTGIMSTEFRKPDCTYNPYDFEGETECKKTCLWLKGLEPLRPTRAVPLPKEERTQGIWKAHFKDENEEIKKYAWNDPIVAKLRSKTPRGVAKAMAEQWGKELKEDVGSECD